MKPQAFRWQRLTLLGLGGALTACAQGVAFEPAENGEFSLDTVAGSPALPGMLDAGSPAPAAGSDATDPAEMREPCTRGQVGDCPCPETGTAGMRRCVFDETSPSDGFFEDLCRGCSEPTCDDGVPNASETDIDCGGGECAPCADAKACAAPTDCEGGLCTGGVCRTPAEAPDAGSDTTAPPDASPPSSGQEPAPGCDPATCPDCSLLTQPCCSDRDECGCNLLGGALLCN